MQQKDAASAVIYGQLEALSTLEENGTASFRSEPAGKQTDICAQTRKAKQTALRSSVTPQRPNYAKSLKSKSMISNRIGRSWKMPIAEIINESHPPISPLRSNLSRTGKNSDAGNKQMLLRVGYGASNYYHKKPQSQFGSHALVDVSHCKANIVDSKMSASVGKDSPKKQSISRQATPISGDKLLERYSVLPDIMKAVTHINRQTNRVKEGAKLLRALRQKSGLAERSKRKDKMLMVGSQRRQYVRTFFGKDVSRFNSPRRDLGVVDYRVAYDMKKHQGGNGSTFDSNNFNNGWGGRFG